MRVKALTVLSLFAFAAGFVVVPTQALFSQTVFTSQSITALKAETWSDVTTAGGTVAAITTTGRLFTWGENTYGTVGKGSTTPQTTPYEVVVPGVPGWKDVASGTDHMVAVTTDGRLFVWGRNHVGQLGTGNTTNLYIPTHLPVSGATAFFKVAVWGNTTVALNQTTTVSGVPAGVAYAWGDNSKITASSTPSLVAAGVNLTTIEVGRDYAVGMTTAPGTNGATRIWGDGVLGVQTITTSGPSATFISTSNDWIAYLTGNALSSLGRSAGGNTYGQLLHSGTTSSPTFLQMLASTKTLEPTWARIFISSKTGIATRSNNNTYAWGDNSWAQYGNGTTTSSPTPTLTFIDYKRIYQTMGHLTEDPESPVVNALLSTYNELYVWGYNEHGQSGDGTTSTIVTLPRPVKVLALS